MTPTDPTPLSALIEDAAIEECVAHHDEEHVALIPPCGSARRDAKRWADRFTRLLATLDAARSPAAEPGVSRTIERLAAKARRWHDAGTMNDSEYGAVCAVLYVEGAAALSETSHD